MKCPHCKKTIPAALIARAFAAKGGAAGKGTKTRSDLNKKAAQVRWAKEKTSKPKETPK